MADPQVIAAGPVARVALKADEVAIPGDPIGFSTGFMRALATVATAIPSLGIALQAGDGAEGDSIDICQQGKLVDEDAPFTAGSFYYLGEGSAGAFKWTATAPSTTGDVIQMLGFAADTKTLLFNLVQPVAYLVSA